MADSTDVLEDKIPGVPQTDCLTGKGSEGDRGPCAACQSIIIIIIIIIKWAWSESRDAF